MRSIKIVLFFIGIILMRYVGGVPTDSHNFFITHFVFFTPFLLDYYKLLSVENKLIKFFVILGFAAGIGILLLNIIGIFQIVEITGDVHSYTLTISNEYYMGFDNLMSMPFFLNLSGVVYGYIFFGYIVFEDLINVSPKISEAKGRREAHANTG
ncbi:hypothetical protein FZC78_19225 [Rossellomorea vietnamensis]|uniref:Uncharacterized protein n=1 Tax=Rossellomorea vietnamensis TaxID=218284 RepID=A0A5D4NJP6_9BACI|nr:hypothetical protein [Rossellomorea vietnamensis]TYS14287.1 hypothetical protein FZC78_19225 [Rossellomorea vietnamensis]